MDGDLLDALTHVDNHCTWIEYGWGRLHFLLERSLGFLLLAHVLRHGHNISII
jgi:hypothetical protein